jgi:hypothetical protein
LGQPGNTVATGSLSCVSRRGAGWRGRSPCNAMKGIEKTETTTRLGRFLGRSCRRAGVAGVPPDTRGEAWPQCGPGVEAVGRQLAVGGQRWTLGPSTLAVAVDIGERAVDVRLPWMLAAVDRGGPEVGGGRRRCWSHLRSRTTPRTAPRDAPHRNVVDVTLTWITPL